MFKNRKITVTMDKKNDDKSPDTNPYLFETKAEIILQKLEDIGKKVFIGICIYVALDTFRQVSIAKANQPETQTFQIKAL